MPGLTLSIGEREQYEKYMDAAAEAIRQFINKEPITVPIYEIEQPDSLLWATWCLQQYRKNQREYAEEMKLSPAFYQTIHGALMKACFMEIAKLYDSSNGVVSIGTLLAKCEGNQDLFRQAAYLSLYHIYDILKT